MSDLIERLRQCWCDDGPAIVEEAADRIAELEAANAKMRKALLGLLKFHQEGDDGAELPREFWSGNYLDAVEAAEEVLK